MTFGNFLARCNLRAATRVCVLLSCALSVEPLPGADGPKIPDYIPPKRSGQVVDGFGVNVPLPRDPYLPWSQHWWTRIFDSGFKFVRIGQYENCTDYTSWDWVERKRGHYAIPKEVDDYVDSLVDNGVTIDLQLLYGNGMYTSPIGRLPDSALPRPGICHPPDRGVTSVFWAPTTPEQIRAFANYARWTVNHFRGRVKYYEIWNEPSEYFWNPGPTPKSYASLAREVIATVHQADPTAKVIFGAFGLTEREFPLQAIEACNCAHGIDVFSYHAYGDFGHNLNPEAQDEPSRASESPALLRDMVRQRAGIRGDIAFWNDEFNAPPSWESDEWIQAKYIVREMISDRASGVQTFVWELIPGVDGDQGDDYGLIHGMMMRSEDFAPRPALLAVQNTNAVFSDTILDASISVSTPHLPAASPAASVRSYAFRSSTRKAIIAFWLPVRSTPGSTTRFVIGDLKIKNSGIQKPVLIDLVSGRVSPISWKVGTDDTLESLHFQDSVMAIADESYFDWAVLPDAPASLRVAVSNGKTTLTWILSGLGTNGVVIEERRGAEGKWQRSATLKGPITKYTLTSLKRIPNVYYRVRAVNKGGESAYSNIVQVKTGK